MKFLFLVLFLGVAQATFVKDYDIHRDVSSVILKDRILDLGLKRDVRIPVDKDLIDIQIGIIKLLKNVNHLNTDKLILDISKNYRLEDMVDRFIDRKCILDLIRLYKIDGFLNRDKVFNILDERHRYEVKIITKVLLNAKDIREFYKIACWLRNRINSGMFVYALSVAVKNRDDCLGVILPPLYEIIPTKFFKNKVIQKALQLKMQGDIFDVKYAKTLGIEVLDKNVFLIKSDYTGVNIHNNGEERLNYFTEDIGLNNNYYMAHITTPFWLDYNTIKTTRHNDYRRGELYLFMHQQLLARYYMERLCNGLGEIDVFKWNLPIKTGYNPSLRYHNGLEYSVRPNNYILNTVDNIWMLKTVKDIEMRIRNAIDRGYVWTDDGKMVSLRRPEDIDILGNLIQCNRISVNERYYCGLRYGLNLLGNRHVIDDNNGVTPTVLENYSTMLRDPVYYQLMKRILFNVYKFNTKLVPYTYDDLIFKGVRINDVKVDKLVTYFDTFDVDITNVVNRDIDEMRMNKEDILIKTRQVRLNHLPFNVEVDVTSDISTDVVIKTFLGPKFDGVNRKIRFDDNRINFFLLDRHVITLKKGVNTIVRNSRQFNLVTDDMIPTRKLTMKIDKCLKGEEECFTRDIKNTVLIPDRLLLPRGTQGGMPFQLFVTITPVLGDRTFDKTYKYDTRIVDTLRFPLDRKIIHIKEFLSCDNFFLRDVLIYNKEGIVDKYTGVVKDSWTSSSSESSESLEHINFLKTLGSHENIGFLDNISGERIYGKKFLRNNLVKKYGLVDDVLGGINSKETFLGNKIYNKDFLLNSRENILGRKGIYDVLGRVDSGEKLWGKKRFLNKYVNRGDSYERFGGINTWNVKDSRENWLNKDISREVLLNRLDSRENVWNRRLVNDDSREKFINKITYFNDYNLGKRFNKFDNIHGLDSKEMKMLKKKIKLNKYY